MTRFSLRALAVIFAAGTGVSAWAQQAPPARRRPAQTANGQRRVRRQSVHDQFSGQGYGVAGCGLGSVIFGPKPGLIQIIAVTFNGTAYNQSFGITSGTSNCDIPESGAQAAAFIEVNKEIVRKEAAQGEGETIRALAEIMECGDEAKLAREVRGNYEHYFAGDVNSYETIRRLIASGTCTTGEG